MGCHRIRANKERIGPELYLPRIITNLPNLKNISGSNYSMAIEEAGAVVFLRKVTEGGSSESYGIEV